MRLAQFTFRQTSTPLLIVFAVLSEEKNASRAAARLREMFHDDLLTITYLLLIFVGSVRNSEINQTELFAQYPYPVAPAFNDRIAWRSHT